MNKVLESILAKEDRALLVDNFIEDSNQDTIIFYQLNSLEDDKIRKLEKVLLEHTYKLIVINNFIENDHEKLIQLNNSDFFEYQKRFCDLAYPIKEEKKIIGVTGTNGKTTTVDLCRQIMSLHKKKAFTVGTLGVVDHRGEIHPSGLTTPPYSRLRKMLFKFFNEHDYCFMEVSSHALEQNRIYRLKFEKAGWTSFSQDHLDYHGSMDKYLSAKLKILNYVKDGKVCVPSRGELQELLGKEKCYFFVYEFSQKTPPFFRLNYNKNNFEVAYGICSQLLGSNDKIDLNKILPPKGRFEIFEYKGKVIVIDYAHTPDALEKVGSEIKQCFPDKLIWTVFGCGGDRDKLKRPLMLEAAKSFSSQIIVTTDNPRSEEPKTIIDDITANESSRDNIELIVDRSQAIKWGFENLPPNGILLIAGKGHEEYQEIKGIKLDFSDRKTVEAL